MRQSHKTVVTVLLTAVAIASCGGRADSTSVAETSAATTATTVAATTATTAAATTTTPTSTTTAFPPPAISIDGVPDHLIAFVGGDMPEFDRTIAATENGAADPVDVQRWLDGWDTWHRWVQANLPSITEDTFAYGTMPGSEFFEIWIIALEEDPIPTLLSESLGLLHSGDDSSTGTGFTNGTSLIVISPTAHFHTYVVLGDDLEAIAGPRPESDVAFYLTGTQEADGTTIWRASSIEY